MSGVNAARGAAPGRARATVGRVAPGPDADTDGAAPGPHGAAAGADAAGVVFPDGPGAHAARLVWGVLTAVLDPLTASAIGSSAAVAPQLARAALEFFEQAGLVLCIPGEPSPRGRPQQLWVLAGGVREGLGIAAVPAGRDSAPSRYGHGPGLLAAERPVGAAAPPDPGSQAGNVQGADASRAAGAVDLEEVLPFPAQLPQARPGHRRVWKVLIEAQRVLRTVEVAEAAGISRSAAASALSALARVRAVRRFREGGSDNWALPPAALAARDRALGVTRPASPPAAAAAPPAAKAPAPVSVAALAFPPAPARETAGVGAVSGLRRLRKGELEAMVLGELRRRYPEQFGPTGLSHLLGGYSSGAITNVLTRLEAKKLVECTCPAPKRYRATPAPEARGPKRRRTP